MPDASPVTGRRRGRWHRAGIEPSTSRPAAGKDPRSLRPRACGQATPITFRPCGPRWARAVPVTHSKPWGSHCRRRANSIRATCPANRRPIPRGQFDRPDDQLFVRHGDPDLAPGEDRRRSTSLKPADFCAGEAFVGGDGQTNAVASCGAERAVAQLHRLDPSAADVDRCAAAFVASSLPH